MAKALRLQSDQTMDLRELADHLGARILTGPLTHPIPISGVFAADRISDLLNGASPSTMLVTHVGGAQILQVADLMDAPAVCFPAGTATPSETEVRAIECGIVLLLSPFNMEETCRRVSGLLGRPSPPDRPEVAQR